MVSVDDRIYPFATGEGIAEMPEGNEYMTVEDCAKAANLTVDAIYKAIQRGRLKATRFGKRVLLISTDDFQTWNSHRKVTE